MGRLRSIRPNKHKAAQRRNAVASLLDIRFAQEGVGESAIPSQSSNHITASPAKRTLVLTGLPIGASFSVAQAFGPFAYSSAASRRCLRIVETWRT